MIISMLQIAVKRGKRMEGWKDGVFHQAFHSCFLLA
jgi:hypothetical protein